MKKRVLRSSSHDPINLFFGLTYASYLVIPRSILQAASLKWQRKFVATLHELDDELQPHTQEAGSMHYEVRVRDPETSRFVADPYAEYRHPRIKMTPRASLKKRV